MLSDIAKNAKCELCGTSHPLNKIREHVIECFSDPDGQGAICLLVYSPYRKAYKMWLALSQSATFEDLDESLRDEWLECCGHLSRFITPRGELVSEGFEEDEGLEPGQIPMAKVRVIGTLRRDEEIDYEYDMGSTTELKIKNIGTIRLGFDKGEKIVLLAKNEPPEALCDKCGAPAEFIVAEGWSGDVQTFCSKCAENMDEDSLLPLVNSPRTGICGYTGEL